MKGQTETFLESGRLGRSNVGITESLARIGGVRKGKLLRPGQPHSDPMEDAPIDNNVWNITLFHSSQRLTCVAQIFNVAEKDDYLVDILVDLGFVTPDQVAGLRAEAQSAGVGLVDLMLANKMVRPADVTQAKAAHFGAEVVDLNAAKITDEVIATIPRHIARKYRVVPVFKHETSL